MFFFSSLLCVEFNQRLVGKTDSRRPKPRKFKQHCNKKINYKLIKFLEIEFLSQGKIKSPLPLFLSNLL